MKVLHILYQSLPQVSGSSIRSRDILMSQKEIGIDVLAVTAPFQPANLTHQKIEYINDIKYIRTSKIKKENISDEQKPFFQRIFRFLLIFKFIINLYKISKKENPDILHAHAMFFCGIPAIIVGKLLKIPVVYEFRSLWMNNKSKKSKLNTITEKLLLNLEIFTLNKSNYTIALNDNLKDFLIKKGVHNKIKVIPNAVNITLINQLKKKIKLPKNKKFTFGYIGTITHYEGLPMLVEAFQKLSDEGIKNKLLIFGKGIDIRPLKTQIAKRKDITNIEYIGAINPLEIYMAFSKIDVIINPRLKSELTDTVTPLKPLEAMAYNKIVLGSDVGGIKELIKNNYNGFLFKAGNISELKKAIKKIIKLDNNRKNEILTNSQEYITQQKSWAKNAKLYKTIYSKLI